MTFDCHENLVKPCQFQLRTRPHFRSQRHLEESDTTARQQLSWGAHCSRCLIHLAMSWHVTCDITWRLSSIAVWLSTKIHQHCYTLEHYNIYNSIKVSYYHKYANNVCMCAWIHVRTCMHVCVREALAPSDSECLSVVPVLENAHGKRSTAPVSWFSEQFTIVHYVKGICNIGIWMRSGKMAFAFE